MPGPHLVIAALSVSCAIALTGCSSDTTSSKSSTSAPSAASSPASSPTSPADTPGDGISVSEGPESESVSDDSSGGSAPAALSPGAAAPAACRKVATDLTGLAPYLSASQPLTGERAAKAHAQAAALRSDAASGPAALSTPAKTLADLVDELVADLDKHDSKAALKIVAGGALERPATQIAQACGIKG